MLINIDVFIIERESLWRLLVDTKKILTIYGTNRNGNTARRILWILS